MRDFDKREEALETLFSLYERPMYHYALKLTADPYLSEDVVQDAFCKMIKYVDSIHYENDEKIKSYLFAVTRTCAADHLRKNKIQTAVTNKLEDNVLYIENNLEKDYELDMDIGEMSFDGDLGELVSKLKEEDQSILYLRYGRDANDGEIADVLSLRTEGAVRKRLSRAKQRLKNLMNGNERERGTNG